MEEMKDKQIIQQIIDHSLSGIPDDPWLAQRVLSEAKRKEEIVVKKKISVTAVMLVILILMLGVAAAGSLGVFGRLTHLMETMGILERTSTEVNASITVFGDTFTVNQAYFTGDILFLSLTQHFASDRPYGKSMEPWTPEENNDYWCDSEGPDHLWPKAYAEGYLEPGESGKFVSLEFSQAIILSDDAGAMMGRILANERGIDDLAISLAYNLPEGCPGQLNLRIPIVQESANIWRDDQGLYWMGDYEMTRVGYVEFTVQRSNNTGKEYIYTGPVTCHNQNRSTSTFEVDIHLVRCPEINLCYVRCELTNTPDSWRTYVNYSQPCPDDYLGRLILTADHEEVELLRCYTESWYNENHYKMTAFFKMDGDNYYELYQVTPARDEVKFGPTDCFYDSISLIQK